MVFLRNYGAVRFGTVRFGSIRFGDASGINSVEILYSKINGNGPLDRIFTITQAWS